VLRRTVRVLILGAAVAAAACTSGPAPPDDSSYLVTLAERRANKDREFRESDDPVPPNRRDELLPLRYYPPDPAYAVPAQLRPGDGPIVEVPTSTGTLRRLQVVGTLEFTLNGQQLSLGALAPPDEPIRNLFVPFADLTTGKETYSAGRYLDVTPTATGIYTIDFNYAYNPYCAYNASYECPYPPPSNRLKLPILAGEKAPGI
jgi:uncharacterized protein (DUF1684 family)